MASLRFSALNDVLHRKPKHVDPPSEKISSYFGENVFNQRVMRQYLTDDAFKSVEAVVIEGKRIERKVADQIASSMRDWALSKGATHYTHWFQPLTGATAEKHDSFFEPLGASGDSIEKFDGTQLVQQEPDASSFPNGGIRNTFEARGYTIWDPTSPAFIIDKTLCIPTIFIAYTGEALDNKTPLLRALNSVDEAATQVCQYFDKNVTKVNSSLGWEQEYFLVDKAFFNARPDLVLTGRALFGHAPAKGQQLDDHYFGTISERVNAFMRDFENESLRLGIPLKTRHNEVAPNQFECAPIYEEANLANDHNLLLMDIMDKVARRHDFRVLFHEKPFAGLNGSGKHNNWSLSTNTGVNLLAPGKNPKSNLQFLTFFINTIAAIYKHADILRASIASAGNDHRLGANEAPPAIISVFIGSQLSELLDELEANVSDGKMSPEKKTALKMEIGKIPEILLDNTDRNRTSPFAFTGNKFEFRAVGSTANCGVPMTALNMMVAEQLIEFKKNVDAKIEGGLSKDEAILQELRVLIVESKNIRFEGNGYGEEWAIEAKRRGLSNLKDSLEAIEVYERKDVIEMFDRNKVLTPRELESRYEIELEKLIMKLQIEGRVMGDMVKNHVIPTAYNYQNKLIENVSGMISIFGKEADQISHSQKELIKKISMHVDTLDALVEKMIDGRRKANKIENSKEKARAYVDNVKSCFAEIRYHADKLEMMIDDEIWPLPKFREMLFTR
jgi:glutamine synthetase